MSIKSLQFSCFLGLMAVVIGSQAGCGRQSAMGFPGMMGGAMPKTEVIVDTVKTQDVQLYMYVPGKTSPYKEVEIQARISGYLEQLLFVSGGIVKKDDKLAVIEQDQYQVALDAAKAELEVNMARAQLAKANLDRAQELVKTKTIAEEEYQSKQAEYDMAVATVELAKSSVRKAELDLGYTEIVAPIPGKTTKNLVDVGNYISPGSESAKLLTIAQMDPIYIDFEISDRQLTDIKERMGFRKLFDEAVKVQKPAAETPEVAVPSTADNSEKILALNENRLGVNRGRIDVSLTTGVDVLSADFPLTGFVVALIDNRINTETGQITLRGEVRNPLLTIDGNEDYMLYPGQICRVRIPYEMVKDAVLVHEEAILTDLDTKYVLVVKKEEAMQTDMMGHPMLDKETGKPIPVYQKDEAGKDLLDASGKPIPVMNEVVHRRDIKIGRLLDTQQRIVLSGLKKGETYITKGVQRARIGVPVDTTSLEDFQRQRSGENGSSIAKPEKIELGKAGETATPGESPTAPETSAFGGATPEESTSIQ